MCENRSLRRSNSMSRDRPMRITRIQYWKTPLTTESSTISAANSNTSERRKPFISESMPLRMANGSAAFMMSVSKSAPMPSAISRRYFQR